MKFSLEDIVQITWECRRVIDHDYREYWGKTTVGLTVNYNK